MSRKAVHWRRDPAILARLPEVERRHFAGQSNTEIAAAIGVNEITVRRDLERLSDLWREQIATQAESLRAKKVRELEDIKRRALGAAEFDTQAEIAVLYGQAHPDYGSVYRDDKGSAQFRGNKQGALNVARQCVMDQAKVLGLVVEKQEYSGEPLVRIYERGSPSGT